MEHLARDSMINFRSHNILYFLSYIIMDTCIAIIMYCQIVFLLFTGKKQHCLHNFLFGGPISAMDLPSCKISSSVVLRFLQYISSTRLRRGRT